MSVRYNLEFAHIYVDEEFSLEHKKGVDLALKIIKKLPSKSVVTSVLVDDYNPTAKTLKIDEFIKTLKKSGLRPDFIALESALVRRSRQVLNSASDCRLVRGYERYIEKHNKYPCSFLVAVWDLIRLGKISAPDNLFYKSYRQAEYFAADELITVLPKYFEEVEDKAQALLKKTSWGDLDSSISHYYLDKFETFKSPTKKIIY